jgi:D-3-phosphoglycerate dehydrogenase
VETVRGFFRGRHEVDVVTVPDPPAPAAVREAVAGADLVIGDKRHKHRLDRETLSAMQRCRLIQQPAVGFDVIDHEAAAEFGIPVANAAAYNSEAVADWTLMAILNLLRMGAWADSRMHRGEWPREQMRGREVGALTVGIIGLGNVGSAVARRLLAFGATVVFCDLVPRRLDGADAVDLDGLLAVSDVVCVHTYLDPRKGALLDASRLGKMKPGAILVNAARGPLVDEGALLDALRSGHLGGAGLDVYEQEPLAAASPLRELENVFLSPHVAGSTHEAEARLLDVVGANLLRVLDGEPPVNVVNGMTPDRVHA